MSSSQHKLGIRDIPIANRLEVLCAQFGKPIEELLQGPPCKTRELGLPIEWVEGALHTELNDDAGPGKPVRLFPMDQMPDHIVGTPGARSFVGGVPGSVGTTKERIKNSWRALKQIERLG